MFLKGRADIYIDDGTTVVVESSEENVKKANAAVMLAMHIIGRASDKDDPLQRKDLVSMSKLEAEGQLEETKILLGWKLDSRNLMVYLPTHKYIAWSNAIKAIIKKGKSNFDELETTLGRLAHTFTIIPHMIHFTSRIRSEMYRSSNRRNKKGIKLSEEVILDLSLHLNFLEIAHKGISMNLITFRKPTIAYRSDACPAGIGGYSSKGRAWRWELPTNLRFRATLNMLEHIATIIGPWIDIIEGNMPEYSCVLSMSDSTTAAGWLKKSNFQPSETESKEMTRIKLLFSRSHATRMMENKCVDYSQWFPGDENDLADSLSRDFHLSNHQLTSLFHSLIPKQTPKNLKISTLPKEIESFLFSILQQLPEKTQQLEKHKHSGLSLGKDGKSFLTKLESKTTTSSTNSQVEKETSSCHPLPKQSEKDTFLEEMSNPWFARQSAPPWTTYLRPSEISTDPIHASTATMSLAAFYNNSTKASKMRTQSKNKKKPSQ